MSLWRKKYRISAGPLSLLALTLFNGSIYSQKAEQLHPLHLSNPDALISRYLLNAEIPAFQEHGLAVHSNSRKIPGSVFYDSLKIKASKFIITRRLYDFVVVNGEPASTVASNESSDKEFIRYTGKKIASVSIVRLGVFGSDINNPLSRSPNKLEAILNKTHLNTNEYIIRKNLLFSVGDTVSPLVMSDNERLLRQLPFIDDSRIIIEQAPGNEVNIIIYTKDVYSLGLSADFKSIDKGSISIFDKNIIGLGHEFKIDIPFNHDLPNSPGFGLSYSVDNIGKSFINMNINYFYGLGQKTYGFSLEKKLVSSSTRYAGGISIREMFTRVDLDTLTQSVPLKYNLQDYWGERSFLLDKNRVTRLIIGARYTNNNVFNHPFILPNSYRYLQQYRLFLGSVSFSEQKFFKTSLLYAYGRTEDIPYGALLTFTAGREISEFKERVYTGLNLSFGRSIGTLGYFYTTAGASSFFNNPNTEEGLFIIRTNYFSNLIYLGTYKIRNFVKVDYSRGFDRYLDEHLHFVKEGGLSGVSNDSVGGNQRLSAGFESVLFSPRNLYGFRFAFFAFTSGSCLFGTNQIVSHGVFLSAVGIGIRIRNDNLLLNTIQIKLGFYPNLPPYSRVNYFSVSGEQLFKPDNFDPGPPSTMVYQ